MTSHQQILFLRYTTTSDATHITLALCNFLTDQSKAHLQATQSTPPPRSHLSDLLENNQTDRHSLKRSHRKSHHEITNRNHT